MSLATVEAVAVTVPLTAEDRALILEAAAYKWPGQKMSEAEILLAMARMAGGCMLKKKNEQAG